MKKGIFIGIVATLLVVFGAGAAYFYLTTQNNKIIEQAAPLPTTNTAFPNSTLQPTAGLQPTKTEETSNIPAGWLTYKNQEYGFEISYPDNYKALDDQKNLYGWPDAVVLIYGGGQSYDLPIEVWSYASEYESKYSTQMDSLTVKRIGDKYITLLNANKKAEIDQIIATFRTLN